MKLPMSNLIVTLAFLVCGLVQAHGGGLNSDGCHNERRTGGYHCHGGGSPRSSSSLVPRSSVAPAIYQPAQPNKIAPTTNQALQPASAARIISTPTLNQETQPSLSKQYLLCRQSSFSHVDDTQCLSDELRKQKALLNAEYTILWENASADSRAAIDKAQKAWVNFRDLECAARNNAIQGTGSTSTHFDCLIEHVIIRRGQLRNYFEQ
jgi:uncharacterized protein YecT (DUF1311 family)